MQSLLGPDEPWVMWGPNIRRGTPNAAHTWHVDLESWYWPSITVVVGLDGCSAENATRYIPYSHELKHAPTVAPNKTDEACILRTAKSLNRRCQDVRTFADFGAGRFYAFNAKGWHCVLPQHRETAWRCSCTITEPVIHVYPI